MCSNKYNYKFWSDLENEMDLNLPEAIKSILAITGYEIELCLRNITREDILNIENCIDKNKIKFMENHSDVYGKPSKKSTFKILPGHTKIIFEIGKHFKRKAIMQFDQKKGDELKAEAGFDNVSLSGK